MAESDQGIPGDRIEALRSRVRSAVHRHCPARMTSHIEDIIQEALFKIVRLLERAGETDCVLPSSYIHKAAFHAIVDAMRCSRYQANAEVPMVEAAEAVPDSAQIDPERSSISGAIRQGIQECLSVIAESKRAAVVLHLQGHSVPEIGALMAWSQSKATNLVYRGLNELRQCLEKKGLAP